MITIYTSATGSARLHTKAIMYVQTSNKFEKDKRNRNKKLHCPKFFGREEDSLEILLSIPYERIFRTLNTNTPDQISWRLSESTFVQHHIRVNFWACHVPPRETLVGLPLYPRSVSDPIFTFTSFESKVDWMGTEPIFIINRRL